MTSFRIANARILTMNGAMDVVDGDVTVVDGEIREVGRLATSYPGLETIDAEGDYVLPGFVQAHIHLCQTLFRHEGEDRVLLRWLRERIWPLEGAHDAHSLAVSARLGIAELLLGGTTCLLDMGTVHHQEAICDEIFVSGIRAALGKAMMDDGEGVPASLMEDTRTSIDTSLALAKRWHGADRDRIRYAFAPRFVLSCTEDLHREVARLSREYGYLIHTHASEQVEEVEIVEQMTGHRNVAWLHELGLCSERSVFAHGVHLDNAEIEMLAGTRTTICHCPSSNLKLGSGVAQIPHLLREGVRVALGADGAPCNNGLDAFVEMRLAHLLQCREVGPGALSARDVLTLATRGGAEALGWGDRIGSVEVGKDADIIRLRRDDFRTGLEQDPYAEIVCAGARDLVRDVWVRGERLVNGGAMTRLDPSALRAEGVNALRSVMGRAGIITTSRVAR